jgi:hypothetical protein
VTSLWRSIRPTKEERVAKLEWAANGGLGRATIGKVSYNFRNKLYPTAPVYTSPRRVQTVVPMADLVRQDPRGYVRLVNPPPLFTFRTDRDGNLS